jgi:hypothetical protein
MTHFHFSVGERVYVQTAIEANEQPTFTVGIVRQRYTPRDDGKEIYFVEWQASEDSPMRRAWLEDRQLGKMWGDLPL